MDIIGGHQRAEVLEGKDVNGLYMVVCRDCETCAHANTIEKARADLSRTPCTKDCENCKALKHSTDTKPAVPLEGTCNDVLHTCPNDNTTWWQFNTHYHLWKQVTSHAEFTSLRRDYPQRPRN